MDIFNLFFSLLIFPAIILCCFSSYKMGESKGRLQEFRTATDVYNAFFENKETPAGAKRLLVAEIDKRYGFDKLNKKKIGKTKIPNEK